MKRSLFFAFICLLALGSGAQNIPLFFTAGHVPYHRFITQNKPTVNGTRGNSPNQLKDFTAHFKYADEHYVYGSNGWYMHDSSTFFYIDSLSFPKADTTLAYVSSNQSWVLDSEFSVSSYYMPSQPVTDQDSFQASKTGEVYNTGSSSWSNTYQYNYGYDNEQRVISVSYQVWSGSWTNVSQITYAYDNQGRLDTLSTFTYNSGSSSWQNDTQYVYYYNIQNQDSVVRVNLGNGGGWDSSMKYIYQYTPVSNLFTGIDIDVVNDTVWGPYGIYSYTRNNNQANYLFQLYVGGQYVNNYEEVFTLDYRNNVLSFENNNFSGNTPVPLVQYTYTYDIDNDVTFEQDAYWNNGGYTATDQYYYFWEWMSVTGINEVSTNLNASIFPNPSYGNLNIRLSAEADAPLEISVYDISGRKVGGMNTHVTVGDNTMHMQLNQLAAGNYLVNLKDLNSGSFSNLNWMKQ